MGRHEIRQLEPGHRAIHRFDLTSEKATPCTIVELSPTGEFARVRFVGEKTDRKIPTCCLTGLK